MLHTDVSVKSSPPPVMSGRGGETEKLRLPQIGIKRGRRARKEKNMIIPTVPIPPVWGPGVPSTIPITLGGVIIRVIATLLK